MYIVFHSVIVYTNIVYHSLLFICCDNVIADKCIYSRHIYILFPSCLSNIHIYIIVYIYRLPWLKVFWKGPRIHKCSDLWGGDGETLQGQIPPIGTIQMVSLMLLCLLSVFNPVGWSSTCPLVEGMKNITFKTSKRKGSESSAQTFNVLSLFSLGFPLF